MARSKLNGTGGYRKLTTGTNRITYKGEAGTGAGRQSDAYNSGMASAFGGGTIRRVGAGGKTTVVSGTAKS